MHLITEGMSAPDFTLVKGDGQKITLRDFAGKNLVLYFYPKDDTPGCTLEAKDFSANYKKFQSLGCEVLGVSKDDVKSHQKFTEKHCLLIPLGSDQTDVCEKYGVWQEKSMYGKKYMGIERSTFLIDKAGKIAKIWRNVKVDGHAEEVLKILA